MSVNSIGSNVSAQNDITSLVQKLVSATDKNKDGSVSVDEFADFLTSIVNGFSKPTAGAKDPDKTTNDTGPSAPAAGMVTTIDGLIDPKTWTDNNAPYGVTFAGFSPQDHTNLTKEDLRNPLNAKYAVFDYLVSNRIEATKDWAPGAADALNQMTGLNIFHAIDGETLGYGDEYVHTAPNGYGMAQGTYDPRMRSEFFWGYLG
jgi:hypothetical protein